MSSGRLPLPADTLDSDMSEKTTANHTPVEVAYVLVLYVRPKDKSDERNLGLGIPALTKTGHGPFVVESVDKQSSANDVGVEVGDHVLTVDGVAPTNNSALGKMLSKAQAQKMCSLTLHRDRTRLLAAQTDIRRRIIEECAGKGNDYIYFIASVEFRRDSPPLGLLIKHRCSKVMVSRVEPQGLSRLMLQHGDSIMDVNGTPVIDKEVAKSLIVAAMKSRTKATFLVERPTSKRAKNEVDLMLTAAVQTVNNTADVLHPPDVLTITQNEILRRRVSRSQGGPTMISLMTAHSPTTENSPRRRRRSGSKDKSKSNTRGRRRSKVKISKRISEVGICSSAESGKFLKHIGKRHT